MAICYGKEIIIVETAWGWTYNKYNNYPNKVDNSKPLNLSFSVKEQKKFFIRLAKIIKRILNNKGKGFFYWEPDFIPVKGAGWKYGEGNEWNNMTIFDFKCNTLDYIGIFSKL